MQLFWNISAGPKNHLDRLSSFKQFFSSSPQYCWKCFFFWHSDVGLYHDIFFLSFFYSANFLSIIGSFVLKILYLCNPLQCERISLFMPHLLFILIFFSLTSCGPVNKMWCITCLIGQQGATLVWWFSPLQTLWICLRGSWLTVLPVDW